ncbi:hypothetical protein BRC91_10705 [Halobacteriales archaeon QS_4_62_28]|nr:MAG: hypothetical protein BRC91_10705 [Halobacteriales archaeon QS_4_62_28]
MVTMAGSASAGCTGGTGGTGDKGDDGDDTDYGDIETPYVMRQGGNCTPLTAFSSDQSVVEFYDYRVPEQDAGDNNNGGFAADPANYSSNGTQDLQRDNESIVFLYDGPDGLSLVIVHGSVGERDGNGGSATFNISGLPAGGSWDVKDDLYNTEGDRADTNYDQWDIGGRSATIDWTWAGGRTDGGAFRGLGSAFSVTIDPAFNEDAELYEQYYEGDVDSWVVLTPDGHRMSVDMSTPLTIETGSCNETEVDFEIVEPEDDGKKKEEKSDFDVNGDYSDDREYSTDHKMFDESGEKKKYSQQNCKPDANGDGEQTAMEKWYSRTNTRSPQCEEGEDTTLTAMERWMQHYMR